MVLIKKSVMDSKTWINSHGQDIRYLLMIIVVWFGMTALTNPVGNFPINDDWVYALAVKSVLETGYYQFPSPSSANVGPQVYWGAFFCLPYGFSFTALRFSTLTLGLIGAIALYGLARVLGANSKIALLGSLVLVVNPLYFGLANSFMTDIPFITLVIIALLLQVKGFQLESRPYLIMGLIISFAAILVRQLGVVLLVAFALAYMIRNGFRWINFIKVTSLVVSGVLLHIAYQYWLVDSERTPLLMVHSDVRNLNIPSLSIVGKKLLVAYTYLGFFILPFLPVYTTSKSSEVSNLRNKIIGMVLVAFALSILIFLWWANRMMPLSENVLDSSGLGPLTLRDTFNLGINFPKLPPALLVYWQLMTIFSVVAACVVLYYFWLASHQTLVKCRSTDFRPGTWPYWLIAGLAATYFAILVIIAGRFPLFDRYLILFLPLIILLIITIKFDAPPRSRGLGIKMSIVLITVYGGYTVAATHDYLAWNRTRWVATNDLMQQDNVSPKQIDGGYEFNGWYLYDAKYKQTPKKSWWWVVDDEYIIASGPIAGYAPMRRYIFDRWLLQRASDVWVLRRIPKH